MPDPRCPYALWTPGVAAGYTRGRNRMRSVKCHYTVGFDSNALIRDQGLAQWLVTRDGRIFQYAEADALCWDSGEWNDDGPGIEIEAYPDTQPIFTDQSRDAASALVHWLHSEWDVPLAYYDGPRLAEGAWAGFISHRSLQQSQPHNDYWPQEDWDAMTTAPAPIIPLEEDMPIIIRDNSSPQRTLLVTDDEVYEVSGFTTPNIVCTKEQADFIVADVRAKYAARTAK